MRVVSRSLYSHEKDKLSGQIITTLKRIGVQKGRSFSSEMLKACSRGTLKDEKIRYTEMVVEFQEKARKLPPYNEMGLHYPCPGLSLLASIIVEPAGSFVSRLFLPSPGTMAHHSQSIAHTQQHLKL